MSNNRFPELQADAIGVTRDALHAYSRVLGDCLKGERTGRKHWWHASLRPSVTGLTTGVVRAETDFELALDFVASQARVRTPNRYVATDLRGQSELKLASWVDETLAGIGIESALAAGDGGRSGSEYGAYSPIQAQIMNHALASVAAALEEFRAGIREETSPIQVWPHHFDLSMIWLPGHKIPGQDPADEEYSDKQMNFGFAFGDAGIEEPYFYVTAYPLPDDLPRVELPQGTSWVSEGFSGAVLLYRDLVAMQKPASYLQELWSVLLAAGQKHLANNK